MPDYVDIHSHIHDSAFDPDREEALARMKEAGVWTITIGTDLEESRKAVALAESRDGVFATVGIEPHEKGDPEGLKPLLVSQKVVAIGECGLDYYRPAPDGEAKRAQRSLFEAQIELAIDAGLPLMIHARSAYADVYDALSSYSRTHGEKVRGDMHFFSGTVDEAKGFLGLGFALSFDGPITFSKDYDEVVRYVPLDMVMAETDAPFAAPAPWRGRRNEPAYVPEIVRRMAEIRGEPLERVKTALVNNAFRVFGLAKPMGL